jgi:hypothetical protein
MTEYELRGEVIELCHYHRLLYHYCVASMRCLGRPGFPDLVIAGPRGLIFAELKSAGGKLDAGQTSWRYTLQSAGVSWHLWTPVHWIDGTIESCLKGLA